MKSVLLAGKKYFRALSVKKAFISPDGSFDIAKAAEKIRSFVKVSRDCSITSHGDRHFGNVAISRGLIGKDGLHCFCMWREAKSTAYPLKARGGCDEEFLQISIVSKIAVRSVPDLIVLHFCLKFLPDEFSAVVTRLTVGALHCRMAECKVFAADSEV
jgi:hypothetical protein